MPSSLLKFKKTYSVKIGGRRYPVVKIGNQLWMAENLDWKAPGITINNNGFLNTPAAWYYKLDEATYGINGNKYGLLYNPKCLDVLVPPTGWRIPTKEDFDILSNFLGGNVVSGKKIKSITGWLAGTVGDDSYKFTAYPTGSPRIFGGDFSWDGVGYFVNFWTSSLSYDSGHIYKTLTYRDDSITESYISNDNCGYSIRLVKTIE